MTIALPLLLLFCGVLSFWLLVESKLSWIFKVPAIALYCIFTVVFFYSISSFLGWAALEGDMPEKVAIHAVVIKEPNPMQNSKGHIYLTVESYHNLYENRLLHMFGYDSERNEPRLYSLPYSRQLHEDMEREVIPRIKDGQVVDGSFKKGKGNGEGSGNGNGKGGKGKGKGKGQGNGEGGEGEGNGSGSESQEDEYRFYNLPPSEIQSK